MGGEWTENEKRMPDNRLFHSSRSTYKFSPDFVLLCVPVLVILISQNPTLEQGSFHNEKKMTCSYAKIFAFIMLVQ